MGGKRGRDDDAGAGALAPAPAAAASDDRVRLYHAHRQHLNLMFLKDLERKIKENPSRILEMEVADYVKFSKSIRVRPSFSTRRPRPVRETILVARRRTLGRSSLTPSPPRLQANFRDVADTLDRTSSIIAIKAGAEEKRGKAFVFGTGDAGQLGLGDDIFEIPVPDFSTPSPAVSPCSRWRAAACTPSSSPRWPRVLLGRQRRGRARSQGGQKHPGRRVYTRSRPLALRRRPAVDVSTGDSHVAVATSDGAVVAWGTFRTSSGLWAFTPDEQIARSPVVVYTPVDSSGRATALASGTDHVIALTAGGDVYSWGCGEKGRLGRLPEADADNVSKRDDAAKRKLLTPSKVPNLPAGGVTAVAAGSYHSFGIAASPDGSKSDVFGWGLNSYGQLGMPYDFSMPASSQLVYFPKRVDELCGRGVVAADGGEAHTVALAASGKVYAFGRSAYGRLGLAGIDPKDDEPRSAMSEVAGIPARATGVVAGGSNSGAVTASGDAYLWGYGELGQIGRGDDQSDALTPERVVPTKNMKDTRVAAVSFGGQHAALLCVPADGGDAGGGPAAKRAR